MQGEKYALGALIEAFAQVPGFVRVGSEPKGDSFLLTLSLDRPADWTNWNHWTVHYDLTLLGIEFLRDGSSPDGASSR